MNLKTSYKIFSFHWITLALGLIVTFLFASYVHDSGKREEERRFREGTLDIIRKIRLRFARYENSLIQAKAFILSSNEVSPDEFHRYFESIELLERYPGLLGLGFIEKVSRDSLETFIGEQRKHQKDYKIWPQSGEELRFPIKFIEPIEMNQDAFGYDMFTDPERKEAMERAMYQDRAVMSSLVRLVQDDPSSSQPSFLIFVPLYDTIEAGSLEERLNKIRGFIYTPFRTQDLFGAIFVEEKFPIDFKVYYAGGKGRDLIFDFQESSALVKDPLQSSRKLKIFGQPFQIDFQSLQGFHHRGYEYGTIAVLIGGVLSTLFLSLLIFLNTRRAMEKTREADALSKALSIRDQFLSIAAHELKTPLTSLQLQIQFAERSSRKSGLPSLEKYQHFLDLLEDSVLRLILLVNDLLDISRIDSGRLKFNLRPTSISSVLNNVLTLLEDPIRNSGCTITKDFQADLEIMADAFKFEQVFSNLLMNSVKYAPGSSIVIRVEECDGMIRITYSDTGPGIQQEMWERIFERFERGNLSDMVQGLGLGLYITREIVLGHSGTIRLVAPEKSGARFIIELPLTSPTGEPAA